MLNYWVAGFLTIVLIVLSNNVNRIRRDFGNAIREASQSKDIEKLKAIRRNAWILMVLIWCMMFYVVGCVIKAVFNSF